MPNKTKLYEHVGNFIDNIVKGDGDQDKQAYGTYLREKVKSLRSKSKISELSNGSIQFKGDDVYVGDRKVGRATSDASDMESGINFVSIDGKFSKEFDDLQTLYDYLIDQYNVTEGRVEDAVSKQSAGSSSRKTRMSQKKRNKDGSPGDYEGKSLDKYHDPIKGKSGEASYADSTDKRHKDGYYDSHDARPKHDDAIKGKSGDSAYQHSTDKRHKDGYYDEHDPRPAQRSRK